MSPFRLFLALAALPLPALAHPGHLVEAAGHSHWVAGAAIGAAVAIALWGLLKGKSDAAAEDDAEPDEDLQEAEA